MGGEYRSTGRRRRPSTPDGAATTPGALCYAPPSPQLDPWCSGPTCQPVTLEIAGSNPVGSAIDRISLRPVRPPGRGVPLSRRPAHPRRPLSDSGRVTRRPLADRSPVACPSPWSRSLGVGSLGLVGGSPPAGPAASGRRPQAEPADEPSAAATAAASRRRRRPVGADRRRPTAAARRPPPAADRPTSRSSRSPTSGRPPTSTTARRSTAVLAGTSTRYEALELVADEADAILAALGVDAPGRRDPARSWPRTRRP